MLIKFRQNITKIKNLIKIKKNIKIIDVLVKK